MNKLLNKTKISSLEIFDLLIEFTYLAVIFLIPLAFSYWFPTQNIFELNKLVLFKVLVWCLLLLTLIKLILFFSWPDFKNFQKIVSVWFKKYWLIPSLFIVGLSFTLFFSLDQANSFFGSYDRGQGLVSYLFYFIWLVLLSFNILTINNSRTRMKGTDSLEKRLVRIVRTAVYSGFLVSVYGILQFLGIDFLTWTESALITHRTFSSFGQPNFLAAWLLLIIPLNFYLIFLARNSWRRIFYLLTTLSALVCLFLTASRGALIALSFVIFLFLIYLLWFTALSRLKKILIIILFLVVLGGGASVLEIALPGRLSSFVDYQSGSLAARFNFYTAAADAIVKKPVFGYGLENSGEVFIKYYEPNWALYGEVNASTDRAHNLILDILLSTGFWGLFFFTLWYWQFFKLASRNLQTKKNKFLSLALVLGGTAYLLALFFGFTIVAGEVYFWLFLALLMVINFSKSETVLATKIVNWQLFRTIISLLVACLIIWQIQNEFRVISADQYFYRLYYTLAQKDYSTSFLLFDYIEENKINAASQNSYDRFLGDKLSNFYNSIDELAIKAQAQKKLTEIKNRLPDSGYENWLVKGKIDSALGNFDSAAEYFSRLISYTPHWPQAYFEEARLFRNKQDFSAAARAYYLAKMNLPNLTDERLSGHQKEVVAYYLAVVDRELGNTYLAAQQYALAEKYYQAAYLNNPSDFSLFKNIADTYYFRQDLESAIKYNQRGYQRNPQDYNWLLALASLEKERGNQAKAIFYLDEALNLAPNNQWLKGIRSEYKQNRE